MSGLPWKAPEHHFNLTETHVDLKSVIWDVQKGFITIDDLVRSVELIMMKQDQLEAKIKQLKE
jgi:hypothetical protein